MPLSPVVSEFWFCLYLCFIFKELLWSRICWRPEVNFLYLISLCRMLVDHKKLIQIGICAAAPHMKMCLFKRQKLQYLTPDKAETNDWQRQMTLASVLFSDIGPAKSEAKHGWLYSYLCTVRKIIFIWCNEYSFWAVIEWRCQNQLISGSESSERTKIKQRRSVLCHKN